MLVTISGKVCGLMPVRSGIGKNGNEWIAQYIVIAIDDDESNKFAFQIFGKEKLESLKLTNGMKIAVTLDFSQAKSNDGAFYTNVFAKDIFVLPPKRNFNTNYNKNNNNVSIDDII